MSARDIVVIGASAGGFQALRTLVGAHSPGHLPQLLAMAGPLPA